MIAAVSGLPRAGRQSHYEQVVRGGTGHLEVVQVTFDPARISYGQLARRFLTTTPTDGGGQSATRRDSYRPRSSRSIRGSGARRWRP